MRTSTSSYDSLICGIYSVSSSGLSHIHRSLSTLLNILFTLSDSHRQPPEKRVKSSEHLLDFSHPHALAVQFPEFLNLPEPLLPEDCSPLVLEEELDELEQAEKTQILIPMSM